MEDPKLQVNDLVQIQTLEGEVRETYPSRVEDLTDDAVIIAWPTDKGKPIPVHPDQPLSISFNREGKYFTLTGKVRSTIAEPIPLIIVQVQVHVHQLERRDNVRVHTAVQLELRERVVSISSFRNSDDRHSFHTCTCDISAGGFGIRHRTFLAIGLTFDVTLSLPDKQPPLTVPAKVVRCHHLPEAGSEDWEIGFAYEKISERTRSRIVRFVFSAQISKSQREPAED